MHPANFKQHRVSCVEKYGEPAPGFVVPRQVVSSKTPQNKAIKQEAPRGGQSVKPLEKGVSKKLSDKREQAKSVKKQSAKVVEDQAKRN